MAMDPISIISLTSAIISFIDFGVKVVTNAKHIRDSAHGTIPELHEIEFMVEDIQRLNANVEKNKTLSKDVQSIVPMTNECVRLVKELRKVLESLKMRDGVWSRTMESSRVFLRAQRKKSDIEDLRRRLENLERRIRANLSEILKSESNSAILSELRSLRTSHQDLEINNDFKLTHLQQEIVKLTEKQTGGATEEPERLSSLVKQLDALELERRICRRQSDILKSLHFPELRRRWSQIEDAERHTSNWLFDRAKTNFVDWLESQEGIFWITGMAGSGKSTLMKFASQHPESRRALEQWARPGKLCIATHYFWNQGFEMQKSQLGLLQSLVFQILRNSPSIIPQVCPERQEYDQWSLEELEKTLQLISAQKDLQGKFCFFIDGLDEYNGTEEKIADILTFLAETSHVKLCVSTRPRTVFDERFDVPHRALVIQDFTADDMKMYVRQRLRTNDKFQSLEAHDSAGCEGIISQIAEQARGVWLWVFLVTRDLVYAVNRNEQVPMLEKILRQFPVDLNAYFGHIIDGVKPSFREEMAQIFLITIEEVQPLPLYAFSLLEKERQDPDYAIKAPIEPIDHEKFRRELKTWAARLQNRCSDLLIVDNGPHPAFDCPPVDFLHRTVRDFLQDNYYSQLKAELPASSSFNPLASLCKMMLILLKSLPDIPFSSRRAFNPIIMIVDELLYYAHEHEKRNNSSETPLMPLLDEVDRVNTHHARTVRNHWTHARDLPQFRDCDEYYEGGKCNFLALAIQARLTGYVRAKLLSSPTLLREKHGRPYLDYALRPRRVTPITMPYHSSREEASISVEMATLLLSPPLNADPNQKVHLNSGRTVWALFLLSCLETSQRREASDVLRNAWYSACELLIKHGARADAWFDDGDLGSRGKPLTVGLILGAVFGQERAMVLKRLMEEEALIRRSKSWFAGLGKAVSAISAVMPGGIAKGQTPDV